MNTITVSNGDIQLVNGKIDFSYGSSKLIQDLQRWFMEPIGTGFTTPGFGSLLPGLVGTPFTNSSITVITNEIYRILQLYQSQQTINLENAQNSGQLSYWNRSEIIQSIQSVDVSFQQTSIYAAVSLLTLSNNPINLNISINSSGVNVTNG